MNRQMLSIVVIVAISLIIGAWLLLSEPHSHDNTGDHGHGHGAHDDHAEEMPRGPHGGRLLQQDHFSLEMTIFESGVPPEFHIYAYEDGKPIEPEKVKLTIKLHRTGDVIDEIGFTPADGYLKGDMVIYEPHSFEVEAQAEHAGKMFQWRYENFEGRTTIPADTAKTMGIVTEPAGPTVLTRTVTLSGQVHADPNKLAHVRPRFAGMVTSVRAELGQRVKAGEILARVQSNESLQSYNVTAPINGLIVQRNIQVGEATGDKPLFVITDLSSVWVELDVFSRDLDRVKTGQAVVVETLDGAIQRHGKIDWVSPLTAHASQSVRARIELDNSDGALRPGQFTRGHVTVGEDPVALAVRRSGIQAFRDFQVVYARFGDTYEVRMLELGRANRDWVEVLGGIQPGTEYVTQNSYLIKADIEKSGASHDH